MQEKYKKNAKDKIIVEVTKIEESEESSELKETEAVLKAEIKRHQDYLKLEKQQREEIDKIFACVKQERNIKEIENKIRKAKKTLQDDKYEKEKRRAIARENDEIQDEITNCLEEMADLLNQEQVKKYNYEYKFLLYQSIS